MLRYDFRDPGGRCYKAKRSALIDWRRCNGLPEPSETSRRTSASEELREGSRPIALVATLQAVRWARRDITLNSIQLALFSPSHNFTLSRRL